MKKNFNQLNLTLPESCCKGNTGCSFDGSLRNVKAEPIYTQKVYDAALFNLQALKTVTQFPFEPDLDPGSRIVRITDIRCKKVFNPDDVDDSRNLMAIPRSEISGGSFVKDKKKCGTLPIEVIGPDGLPSQKIVFTDTEDCDAQDKGTPIFGTQTITIQGNVFVEIDAIVDVSCVSNVCASKHGKKECEVTLSAEIPISCPSPIVLTNFFELCIPSVFNTAFLPRFTEFCNVACEPRLATNNIMRDITVDAEGEVFVNLLIALCVTCEKKIIVPVQLCVLSTGFPVLAAEIAPICSTFPALFPDQIDETKNHCRSGCGEGVQAESIEEE